MSTRATYKIITFSKWDATSKEVTYYIHHDGYPQGAATYFWAMHQAKAKNRDKRARFLIGNNIQAEFTDSHAAHGDTEYQYTLEGEILTCRKVSCMRESEDSGTIIFKDYYDLFINKYLPDMLEGYNKPEHYLYRVTVDNCEHVLTLPEMLDRANKLFVYAVRFKDDNPNRAGYMKRGQAWRDKANSLIDMEGYSYMHLRKIDSARIEDY